MLLRGGDSHSSPPNEPEPADEAGALPAVADGLAGPLPLDQALAPRIDIFGLVDCDDDS